MTTNIDSKRLLEMLTEAVIGGADIVPPGFKSRETWQKEWGCSAGQAKKLLAAGVELGLIEMRKFRVKRVNGFGTIQHYRQIRAGMPLKKGKKKA